MNSNQQNALRSKFVFIVIFYCRSHAVARGKQALNKYIEDGDPIPYYLRQWSRRESSFMPLFATYSRELALMCLTTRVCNILCLYHSHHTSSKYSNDHMLNDKQPHIKVTGVAYPRTAVSKQIKKEDDDEDEEDNDDIGTGNEVKAGTALHCGCWTDDALLDFYLWKSTEAESPLTHAKDGWREDLLDPRQRIFVATAFTAHSGLNANSLYQVNSKGRNQNLERLLCHQFRYLANNSLGGLAAEAFKKKHNINI